ncbi:uncharacterized protein MYCFIDRAFT_209482 [Pseudocercospora fijiensis CIRAD86]|uniref:Calcineurin-like phosphoesterase domain-containing protein n=1 Tax=Pseudocercospora fijiensis (strain CIRAD86) TaxID=383855 RepID=N1Q8X1_PSEFD|nr:uncharacterized protein MYCFIDRAFT_209482 [Pseudocercospora fijiensis CIRAD86]EME87333.1 hypothetical protein MYCFIDRAFT_209482 [Pseudocercospora fijiensis CIRAD86]
MSDLHLENCDYNFQIVRSAPYLILGGDVGRLSDTPKYDNFIFTQCADFERVFLILGNHEFYGCSYEKGLALARRLCLDAKAGGKLTLLNREKWAIPGTNTILLGCTLYSHISRQCTRLTRDFARIEGWSVAQHNHEYAKDLQWLRKSLKDISTTEPSKRIVVITHFLANFSGNFASKALAVESKLCTVVSRSYVRMLEV